MISVRDQTILRAASTAETLPAIPIPTVPLVAVRAWPVDANAIPQAMPPKDLPNWQLDTVDTPVGWGQVRPHTAADTLQSVTARVRAVIADELGLNPPIAPLPAAAPMPPHDEEKLLYVGRHQAVLLTASAISFSFAIWSGVRFLATYPPLHWTIPYITFTILYFAISLAVNLHRSRFSLKAHEALIQRYSSEASRATLDFLLPTCGEDITVLANTWNGVRALCDNHDGDTSVFVLDDAARPEVRALAAQYGFRYSVRDNRGWFKKAGNLRHGYDISRSCGHQFVVIFDADFRPRADFLTELLPYFLADPTSGLVQSPQYFDTVSQQNWLQRGAGAVQEFFYRFSQVARDSHDAAICVGTNAIYRRSALDQMGGTALIQHSEDVHTGFNMRMNGWKVRYVPLILAKGTCPDSMDSFFRQQYRWCLGSMSLLGSEKFWKTEMSLRARLCYFTGFCYYVHTALTLFFVPVIPLTLLIALPQGVTVAHYLLVLPTIAYTFLLVPLWHKAPYGSEVWSVKHIYCWAHLFAIVDVLRGATMEWTASGIRGSGSAKERYRVFRIFQAVVSFLPSVVWAGVACYRVFALHEMLFLPLMFTGLFAAFTTGRVTFYRQHKAVSHTYHLATDQPTVVLPALSMAGVGALAAVSSVDIL